MAYRKVATTLAVRVPFLLLPADLSRPHDPALPGEVRPHVDRALASLDDVLATSTGTVRRGTSLESKLTLAAELAHRLSLLLADPVDEPSALAIRVRVPTDAHFKIRATDLSWGEYAAQWAGATARSLGDFEHAWIDINDLVVQAKAMRTMLAEISRWCLEGSSAGLPTGAEQALPESALHESADYLTGGEIEARWIVAHHMFLLFTAEAAFSLQAALRSLRGGECDDTVATFLTNAAVYCRGATAALAHSCAMPAAVYADFIRPSMKPPATDKPLSGWMFPESRAFRRLLNELVDTLPQPFPELADRSAALAVARESLLNADVEGTERHLCVGAALVGDDQSLAQYEKSENAVASLREMRHLRAARYAPLVRYGDDLVAGLHQAGNREQIPHYGDS